MLVWKVLDGIKPYGNYFILTVMASNENAPEEGHDTVDLFFDDFNNAYKFETQVMKSMEPVRINSSKEIFH